MNPHTPSVPPHAPARPKAPFFIAFGAGAAIALVIAIVVFVVLVSRSTPGRENSASTVAAPGSVTPSAIEDPYQLGYSWARQLWLLKGRPYVWPGQARLDCFAFADGRVPTGFYGDLPPVKVPAGGRERWIAGCMYGFSGK